MATIFEQILIKIVLGHRIIPYSSLHSEELQDNNHLVQEAKHSHDAARAVSEYQGPASLFVGSDAQIPAVVKLLLWKAQ